MVGVAFICCTFVAKIKCHLTDVIFNEHLYKMVYYPNIDYDIVYIT